MDDEWAERGVSAFRKLLQIPADLKGDVEKGAKGGSVDTLLSEFEVSKQCLARSEQQELRRGRMGGREQITIDGKL